MKRKKDTVRECAVCERRIITGSTRFCRNCQEARDYFRPNVGPGFFSVMAMGMGSSQAFAY